MTFKPGYLYKAEGLLTKLYARPSIYKPVVKFNFDSVPHQWTKFTCWLRNVILFCQVLGPDRSILGPVWSIRKLRRVLSRIALYENPCTVEKLHPILLGPEQVQLQTSSCSVMSRITFFLITLAPPQVHFGLAATCSSVRAPLAFAGSVGRSIQQATAAESSAGAAGLLLRRSCGQPAEQQRRRSKKRLCIHLMLTGS